MIFLEKRLYIFTAIFHYVISMLFSFNFFTNKKVNIVFYIVEFLYIIILIFVHKKVFYILNNKKKYQNYIKSFIIYFLILFLLLILIWPGIWRWDELYLAPLAKRYGLYCWQNILSSIFYIISLRTISSFVGVVIIQCIIISAFVSYIINKIYELLNLKNNTYKIILYIPFLLPPILDSNLYPLRSTLYTYIMLFYLIKMIEYSKCENISWSEIIKSAFLFALLSNLRSEGCYFLLVTLILSIIFYRRKKIDLKKCIALPIMTLIIFSVLYIGNLYDNKDNIINNYNYNITSTVNPLVHLVIQAKEDAEYDILNKINEVIDVQLILDNEQKSGIDLYWTHKLVRYGYTKKQYSNYMKAYYKLCLMYPDIFFKQRIGEFIDSFNDSKLLVGNTTEIYDYEGPDVNKKNTYEEFINVGGKLSRPININLRKNVINFLEGRKQDNYYDVNTFFRVAWNLIPPLIFCIIGYIYLIIKKKFYYLFLLLTINIKAVLVLITSPSALFMYYLSDYLIGYVIFGVLLIIFIKKIKELKNECSNNNGRIRNKI